MNAESSHTVTPSDGKEQAATTTTNENSNSSQHIFSMLGLLQSPTCASQIFVCLKNLIHTIAAIKLQFPFVAATIRTQQIQILEACVSIGKIETDTIDKWLDSCFLPVDSVLRRLLHISLDPKRHTLIIYSLDARTAIVDIRRSRCKTFDVYEFSYSEEEYYATIVVYHFFFIECFIGRLYLHTVYFHGNSMTKKIIHFYKSVRLHHNR